MKKTFATLAAVLATSATAHADDSTSQGAVQKHCIDKFKPLTKSYMAPNDVAALCLDVVGGQYSAFLSCFEQVAAKNASLFPEAPQDHPKFLAAYECKEPPVRSHPGEFVKCKTWLKGVQKQITGSRTLGGHCLSAGILENFDASKNCLQKIAAKYKWGEAFEACEDKKTRDNPEQYLKNQADVEKCKQVFANEMPGVISTNTETLEQTYFCIEAAKIGQPFWSCYDTLTAEYKNSNLGMFSISHGRYFYFTSCLKERVRENPKQFKTCHNKIIDSKLMDDASSFCQNKIIRDDPAKFLACAATLARGYELAEARKSCTVPHVLKDPAGFLKRNPGKPQPAMQTETLPPATTRKGSPMGAKK
jgi:hypothetical protein